jgi:hypothetical protein
MQPGESRTLNCEKGYLEYAKAPAECWAGRVGGRCASGQAFHLQPRDGRLHLARPKIRP